jgi:hypothetical protein
MLQLPNFTLIDSFKVWYTKLWNQRWNI